ncbi:hypothetical protein HN681_00560 [archaeon]|jgi:hypothetical protein|nr:hypothetical protein [archaeon]MBT3730723.1 hypothetical protein [archaeon]MBT4669625.1 hypothetical protein [archaeon]MBT5030382.1 hypothetical protein [archaeon]MBT5288325.1 hypothetical protein [archaeon]
MHFETIRGIFAIGALASGFVVNSAYINRDLSLELPVDYLEGSVVDELFIDGSNGRLYRISVETEYGSLSLSLDSEDWKDVVDINNRLNVGSKVGFPSKINGRNIFSQNRFASLDSSYLVIEE